MKIKRFFFDCIVLLGYRIFEGEAMKKIAPREVLPDDEMSWQDVEPNFRNWICAACAINRETGGADIKEFGGDPKGALLKRQTTQYMFASDWEIFSRQDLIMTIQDMMESVTPEYPKVAKVWQYLRIIQNAGFGYVAEYLTLKEALNCALAAGQKLQEVVGSWEELAGQYLEACATYMGKDETLTQRKEAYQRLLASEENPYELVPFDLQLKKCW
ncbi:Protein of unknown function [Selenomonas ruminantium]|uniref:DUF1266 domain-containing protein n=2 Tax=Selenomonas ruminantium TaxID=971 RepID=A0A1H0NNN4_SELRU|nr:Protein of unknown function [Selenomonas ruminantium]